MCKHLAERMKQPVLAVILQYYTGTPIIGGISITTTMAGGNG